MKDYGELEPGLYIQYGNNIKAITPTQRGYMGTWDEIFRMGSESNPSVETLAQQVAWVFTALNKRKQQLLEIPHDWLQGENELDDPPFEMPWLELAQQIDEAMQLYSAAYLLKQRAGPVFIGVRWLDPATIEPDYETATPEDGIRRYWRWQNGHKKAIPGDDILRFKIAGMRELKPGTPASMATTIAASILRGVEQTADVFYENNGLPVMLVKIPSNKVESEGPTLKTAFRRLFNQRRGTQDIRVTAVTEEVEIETLSFAPKDLDQSPLTDREVEAILAAYDVPKSIVLSDAANFATDVASSRRFVASMGARLEYMAEEINRDPDFIQSGYRLEVMIQNHYTMKEDEAQRAGAFLNYTQGGSTKEEAYFLVGIDPEDFPDWVTAAIAADEAEQDKIPPMLVTVDDNGKKTFQPLNGNMQSQERQAEVRAYKNWLEKNENPNPAKFRNDYMSDSDKWFIHLENRKSVDVEAEFAKATDKFNRVLAKVENGAA